MRLYIAEKPSLARAIAEALPGPRLRKKHHIECGEAVVAWCAGHILEAAEPEDYDPALKSWRLDALPIVPKEWKHRVTRPELVSEIQRLLKRATTVVHAGDPDREGQLLVDEVLEHLGWRGPTERLLLNDLSPDAVSRALGATRSNRDFARLSAAAQARQRADWLHGLNATRLYTLLAQQTGFSGVLSVGRVQTPVLGLVVRRDREIESFRPVPFYVVEASLSAGGAEPFPAKWAVGKEHSGACDEEGRLLDRRVADSVVSRIAGQPGTVASYEQEEQSEGPPLGYSLATLQVDAGKQLGLSAARTLELAQRLYELQLLTYPRSDCNHLPEGQHAQAPSVLRAIAVQAPALGQACASADSSRRGKIWSDAQITAHHAIIPTAAAPHADITDDERALYALVARRYIAQFLPEHRYLRTRVEIMVAGELLRAQGRQVLALGWRALVREQPQSGDAEPVLPALAVGQSVTVREATVAAKATQPPKPFSDATLIAAMTNIAQFVTEARAKQVLRDADGIGTPATRASMIETLLKRGFLERKGRLLRSTPLGRAFVAALPAIATQPDLTAAWESAIKRIELGELERDRFLSAVVDQITALVSRRKAQGAVALPGASSAPAGKGSGAGRSRPSKRTHRPQAQP